MKAKDRRQLVTRFQAFLAGASPPFAPYKGTSPFMFRSRPYFAYEQAGRGTLFIELNISQKSYKSEFTVAFGWSRLHRFPEVSPSHYYLDDLAAGLRRYSQPEYLQRIMMFLGKDTWWHFDGSDPAQCEDTLKTVEDLVRLKVIPYLLGALRFDPK